MKCYGTHQCYFLLFLWPKEEQNLQRPLINSQYETHKACGTFWAATQACKRHTIGKYVTYIQQPSDALIAFSTFDIGWHMAQNIVYTNSSNSLQMLCQNHFQADVLCEMISHPDASSSPIWSRLYYFISPSCIQTFLQLWTLCWYFVFMI